MAEWPLVGRESEVAHVRALAQDPASRGVVLAAAAGVGKSRLASELRRSAAHAGVTTLVATGSIAVAKVPLGAMASALSALGAVPVGDADPFTLLQDVAASVADQAGPERIFVVVDDAHLLDNASALLVQHLARSDSTFLVLTIRTREPAPDAVTALWKDGVLERIDLGELQPTAIERLLVAVLGAPIDGGALAALTTRSQGNLLYLRELVEAARDDGTLRLEHDVWRLDGPSQPSARLAELVEHRLGRLTAAERWLLDLLAVGEPLGTRELDVLSAFDVAERLEDLGLIASRDHGRRLELRLAHPLYGEVLRAQMSEVHELRLCRSLAQALESTGLRRHDDVLRVALWRLQTGGASPDHLLAAATAARWRLDLDVAHRLASAAVDAGAGFEAELLTAQLLLRLGRPEEADAEFARLCLEPDAARRVRATLARVDIAHSRGRPHEMRQLLATIEPIPPESALGAAVAARQCTATLILDGPGAALEGGLPDAGSSDAAGTAAFHEARAIAHSRAGQHGLAGQDLARRDSEGHVGGLGWWQLPAGTAASQHLVYTGRLRESIDGLALQYGRAAEIGSTEMQMVFASALGRRLAHAGRLTTALKLVHETEALAEKLSYDLVGQDATRMVALIEAWLGRPAAARRALDAIMDAPVYAFSVGMAGEAQAWLAAAEGRADDARALLLDTAAQCRAIGDRVHEASALHSLVRLGLAADAVDALQVLRAEMDGPWVVLYHAHAKGVVDDMPEELERAAQGFEALDALLLAAETAAHARELWEAHGDSRRVTATRNYALDLAERCEGAKTLALRGLGVRQPLTPAELHTAWAAARGETNKAIAARLQLSVRTVETRLLGVYHKLGVTRREDLAAMLPQPPDA